MAQNFHLIALISAVILVGIIVGRISFLYFERIKKTNSSLYARHCEELFKRSTDYIVLTDIEGKIICINDSCSNLFQFNSSDSSQRGKSLLSILEAVAAAHSAPVFEAWVSIKKGNPVQWESKIFKSENKELSVLWNSVPDVKKILFIALVEIFQTYENTK